MLFQWYLFAFLILMYAVAKVANQRYLVRVAGEYEIRYKHGTAMIVIVVLTHVAATRHPNFIDTWSYYSHFMRERGTWDSVVNIIETYGKDRGFYIFTAIIKALIGDQPTLYFAIIASFCLICVVSVYRRYSGNFLFTIFLFLASSDYVQWTHNGIRQFMAVSMVFAATDLLLRKRYVPYFAVVAFASLFHGTAWIMVPVIFFVQGKPWNGKTMLFMVAVMVAASFLDPLMSAITDLMESTQYANDVDSLLATEGTNPMRVLVFCIPPLMALVFRRKIAWADVPIINLAVNMSIASMGAYIVSMFTSGIFIGRVPIYFSLYNYILLPWLIERFFEKSSAKLVYLAVIACYMGFYYYQMHIVWGAVTAL